LSRLADYDLVMQQGGTNDVDRAIRAMNKQRNKIESMEFAIRWMHQNVHKSVQDAAIKRFPWILECEITDVDQGVFMPEKQLNEEPGGTPTFSYRNGEYFKDGKPLDVLLELCELTGDVECYEGMKEGVGIRIAGLEQEIDNLRVDRDKWKLAAFSESHDAAKALLRELLDNMRDGWLPKLHNTDSWVKRARKVCNVL
jgi:hypothetical protein